MKGEFTLVKPEFRVLGGIFFLGRPDGCCDKRTPVSK